jgi:hypothetical protein
MKKVAVLTILALTLAVPAIAQESDHMTMGQEGGPMAKADKNGDGKISKEEFLAVAEGRFAKMDKNGDGFITKDERPEHGKMREHMKKRMQDGAGGMSEMKKE